MIVVFAVVATLVACFGIMQGPQRDCTHKHLHYSYHNHMQQQDYPRHQGPVTDEEKAPYER